jgi:hypothetical protein
MVRLVRLEETLVDAAYRTNPIFRESLKRSSRRHTVADVSSRRIINITTDTATVLLHKSLLLGKAEGKQNTASPV